MHNLKIQNLNVSINNNKILKNINLSINKGESMVLLGPNGHGKSTLFKTLLKHYSINIDSGDILIDNESIINLTTDEIVNKGIYLSSQNPVEIPGLKTFDLLRTILSKNGQISVLKIYQLINKNLAKLALDQSILDRNINENFSGGERKKIEILILMLMDSDFIFLDEIDSGLDADAINVIGNILLELQNQGKSIIFISHNEKLIDILNPTKAILLYNGEIIKSDNIELAHYINKHGYKKILNELNIDSETLNNDELKNTNIGFYCKNAK